MLNRSKTKFWQVIAIKKFELFQPLKTFFVLFLFPGGSEFDVADILDASILNFRWDINQKQKGKGIWLKLYKYIINLTIKFMSNE